jgi:hypothetical protein
VGPEKKPSTAEVLGRGSKENPNSAVPEDRRGQVGDFGEMKTYLPDDLEEGKLNVLQDYFRATLHVKNKKRVKAGRAFDALKKRSYGKDRTFQNFEDENMEHIKTIQLAVWGYTRQGKTTPLRPKKVKYK